MRDYGEHLLDELAKLLANHVNEENPLTEQAQEMLDGVRALQAQYEKYQQDQKVQ